jgi:hypothetical protein
MSIETAGEVSGQGARTARQRLTTRLWVWATALALGAGFVLIGGGNLDPGPVEARLGLAAGAPFGPMGQVFGGWEPSIWPGQLAPSQLWAWGEGGTPSPASIRWPSAIAGLLAGMLLARGVLRALGSRAAVLAMLCWCGSLALIDRSAGAGLELIAGLATVAALDRILRRGSDAVAGLWAAAAFLAGGWPPLALVAMATIVIGRPGTGLNPRLLAAPVVAALGWSIWALRALPAEAWAAALMLPLTQKPAWFLAAGVVALGLPWSPLAVLAASRSVRDGWTPAGRLLVMGWLQVAGACLLAGTVVPGLAGAARVPALAGLAVAAAACCDRLWAGQVAAGARRAFLACTTVIGVTWIVTVVATGAYLASAVPYYRFLSIAMMVLAVPLAWLIVRSLSAASPRQALLALTLLAACLKLGHWGYYVPEWNYRRSQGPWGRAIGQWVPPGWPLYTTHSWSPDLAFATGRPVRQLAHPKLLVYQGITGPKHVLLLESEFAHWPEDAPPLVEVATFQDEYGTGRVLARTTEEFPWRLARRPNREY